MNGDREVLGCAVGNSEDEAFWSEFLRSLRGFRLNGVRLVISDHHLGLNKAMTGPAATPSRTRRRLAG